MDKAGLTTEGKVPVAVVMISLNEAHNMREVLQNLSGWAQEVFLVDSYSSDDTVELALAGGVSVVQRGFNGFGDQWNFAVNSLPITAPWVMKLDPDERLSDQLKESIRKALEAGDAEGFSFDRQLWFMRQPLPVTQAIVRIWRRGKCQFSDVAVNEHPLIDGTVKHIPGMLHHHDSPDLHHWLEKQNNYTTAEAIAAFEGKHLAITPAFFGTRLQRRMWIKSRFFRIPFRYSLLFIYHYLYQGAWRSGWVGYAWARLRCDVYRFREYKLGEIKRTHRLPMKRSNGRGKPDPRVQQF